MDLTIPHEVESMSSEAFEEMRSRRKAILEAIHRQENNIDDVKEIGEKTLRELAKTEVVVKTEEVTDNTGKKFTAENKMNRLKELRQVMLN